jgi:hypothetical protein
VVDPAGAEITHAVVEERRVVGGPDASRPRSLGSWLASPLHYASLRGRAHTVVELSLISRGGQGGVDGDGVLFSAGIGGMASLSRSWALGGVVQLTTGGEYRAGSIGVRLKNNVAEYASLDVTSGVFTGDGDGWTTFGLPVFGEAALTLADAVSFVTRVESAEWRGSPGFYFNYDDGPAPPPVEVRRTIWRAGVRIGPSPHWASIPAFTAGLLGFLVLPAQASY